MQALAAATAPYFFLSYAHKSRGDARDEGELDYWVGELYRDLCQSVRRQAGLQENLIPGFMDTERRVGDDWPLGVVRALKNCSAFVPLYSSRYFADPNCGKEWDFFTHRMSDPVAEEASIVPAIWDPVEPGKLPQTARAPQFRYRGSEAYETLGLYVIMKVSRYRAQYGQAVRDLASSIVTAAELHPVKRASTGDPDSLAGSFGPTEAYPGPSEHMRMRLTIVAPRRDELPDERRNSSLYGPSALDWNPYAADPARRIAQEAAAVAQSLSYVVEVGDLDQHEDGLLVGEPRYGPQILIIDPWALLVPRTRQLLQHVNDSRLPWVQAVIPWNAADDESRKCEGKLRAVLETTFPRKLAEAASISLMAAEGVPSIEDFDEVLGPLIGAAVRKYLGSAEAHPPNGEVVERPRLAKLHESRAILAPRLASFCLAKQPGEYARHHFKRPEVGAVRFILGVGARDVLGEPPRVGPGREDVLSAMPEVNRHFDAGHVESPGRAECQNVVDPASGGISQPLAEVHRQRVADSPVGNDQTICLGHLRGQPCHVASGIDIDPRGGIA